MNWKTKATIQKTIAFLPDTLANHVYYLLQRNFGNCKNFEPWDKIEMATKILNTIDKKGYEIKLNKLAGNKFSYCNRARHDDYIKIFEKANHIFVDIIASTSNELLELIKKGNFQFDEKFIYKDPIVLATISAFFVTKKSF